MIDKQTLLAQISALLSTELPNDREENNFGIINQVLQSTLTVADALYGLNSHAANTLSDAVKATRSKKDGHVSHNYRRDIWPLVKGVLGGMKVDVEAGLVGDLRRRGIGETLADMLTLAREALADGAINVAAVLAAAAYEDTIRKMGSTLAGVQDRPDLSRVLMALKAANVLDGAPYTTAQGYLKFRNDALHADWARIDSPTVSSVIAFVEGQVLRYFS